LGCLSLTVICRGFPLERGPKCGPDVDQWLSAQPLCKGVLGPKSATMHQTPWTDPQRHTGAPSSPLGARLRDVLEIPERKTQGVPAYGYGIGTRSGGLSGQSMKEAPDNGVGMVSGAVGRLVDNRTKFYALVVHLPSRLRAQSCPQSGHPQSSDSTRAPVLIPIPMVAGEAGLDRSSLVHGLISLGGPVKWQFEVEDLARVYIALQIKSISSGRKRRTRARPPCRWT
jgi:hypothetical protein